MDRWIHGFLNMVFNLHDVLFHRSNNPLIQQSNIPIIHRSYTPSLHLQVHRQLRRNFPERFQMAVDVRRIVGC